MGLGDPRKPQDAPKILRERRKKPQDGLERAGSSTRLEGAEGSFKKPDEDQGGSRRNNELACTMLFIISANNKDCGPLPTDS